jgi:hypothetical protein
MWKWSLVCRVDIYPVACIGLLLWFCLVLLCGTKQKKWLWKISPQIFCKCVLVSEPWRAPNSCLLQGTNLVFSAPQRAPRQLSRCKAPNTFHNQCHPDCISMTPKWSHPYYNSNPEIQHKCPQSPRNVQRNLSYGKAGEWAWREVTNDCSYFCANSAFSISLSHTPQKLNAQGEFKSRNLNCDQINLAAPDKTDLIWMVTLSILENRTHYNNKKRQKWEEEQSQQIQERIRFTIILAD